MNRLLFLYIQQSPVRMESSHSCLLYIIHKEEGVGRPLLS